MPQLLGISAIVYLLIQLTPETMKLASFCGQLSLIDMKNLELMRTLVWSPELIALDWVLMIFAMMPLLLSGPISHIMRSTRPNNNAPALIFFALGYVMVWMLAGLILVPLLIIFALLTSNGTDTVWAVIAALIWSSSPMAQFARNRCHKFTRIGLRFNHMLRDCMRQGIMTATACVGACWAWMMVPMTVENGHILAMIFVMFILFAERLTLPIVPQWQLFPVWETVFGYRKTS